MKRIAILAGNYEEFNRFLEENGGTDSEYKYVWDKHSLLGYEFTNYITYGSFYDRKDCYELEREVKARIRN